MGPKRLTVVTKPDTPEAIARLLALGPGLAGVLSNRVPLLHGTTLRTASGDVLLVGPSGVGKSSLAAAFIARGAKLVADDLAALDDGAVRRGFPWIKLWEDALPLLDRHPAALMRVHPDHAKFYVPVPLATGPAPLRRLVVLSRGGGMAEVRPAEAAQVLLANHRLPSILTPSMQAEWLGVTGQLARRLPVLSVALPGPHAALDSIVASIGSEG